MEQRIKSHRTKKHTLKNPCKPTLQPKFLREYFFLPPKKEFNFFSPSLRCFNFFSNAQSTTNKHSDSLLHDIYRHSNMDTNEEARTANRRLAKKRVQWLIEHSTSYQLLCWVDSLVFRNPLLRKAPKRYRSA